GEFARGGELVTAAYWRTHARQPVQFAAGVQRLAAEGFDTLVEVGPQATLTQLGRRCVPADVWLGPSLQRDRAAWPQLLETLAALWVRGVPVDWSGFDRPYGRRKVALPTYPFQRQRYWIDARPDRADTEAYSPALREAVSPPELVPDDLLYRIEWLRKPHAAVDETSAAPPTNGHGAPRDAVLILADHAGVGAQLAERLERAGVSCWIAHTAAGTCEGSSRGRLCVGPGGRSDWLAALSTIAAARAHLRAVVSLWPLDLASLDSESSGFVAEHTRSLVTHAHLTSALNDAPAARAPQLWLVTRGAQAVPGHSDAIHAGQAAFWGWGRVSRLEHPDTWGGIIDLSAAAGTEEPTFIATEILASDGEDQVARRASSRHVARLARMTMPVPSGGIALTPDAAYLVTGGLGAIGLHVAAWLADHGARHIALVSRRGVEERTSTREVATTLETLRRRGIDARVFPADVADTGAMSAVLDAIRAGGFPLRGVVHAAGLVTPSLIADVNLAVIEEAFSAKVGGALCLDRATAGDQLDFFILFSAAAGVIGSEGLAHYAAANHVLDALAHQRRHRGAAALSLDWGRWDVTSGMLSAAGHRWFDHVGLRAIAPARALGAMEALLRGGATQGAVLDVTPSFFSEMAARTGRAFLDLLAAPAPQVDRRKEAADVLQYLHARVADVIRMDRATIGLDEPVNLLGFDSIMALEVRNRLHREFGVTVSMGDFLNGASIRSLAESVRLQLASQPAEPRLDPRGTAGHAQADDVSINPDDLSDAEVDALLKRVLANEVR
ncbi:MAG: SDR family NAD(P)-dependent oxidoreductase, partial [Vicinamibacterales bacterium]